MQNEKFIDVLKAAILEFLRKQGKEFTFTQLCNHFYDNRPESRVYGEQILTCLNSLEKDGLIQIENTPKKYRIKS